MNEEEYTELLEEFERDIGILSTSYQQLKHKNVPVILEHGHEFLTILFERFEKRPFVGYVSILKKITGVDPGEGQATYAETINMWKEFGKTLGKE